MTRIRKCPGSNFFTGKSVCPIDFEHVIGMILTKHGVKLPDSLSADTLIAACHADKPERVYPIFPIVNFTTSGGEPQVSAVGYGASSFNGMNARTDTWALDRFYDNIRAELLKVQGVDFDVYYWDKNNLLYGYNDGTDVLAGIPLSAVYPSGSDHRGASDPAALNVNVVYKDVEDYMKNLDVVPMDFTIKNSVTGLMPVSLVSETGVDNGYKLIEYYGKGDCTAKYGQLIADGLAKVLDNATAATYDATNNVLVLTGATNPTLKAASVLATNKIYGIEQYSE
jgi:hypothetical protein